MGTCYQFWEGPEFLRLPAQSDETSQTEWLENMVGKVDLCG